eukprot:550727-Amphidinium_carterae.1
MSLTKGYRCVLLGVRCMTRLLATLHSFAPVWGQLWLWADYLLEGLGQGRLGGQCGLHRCPGCTDRMKCFKVLTCGCVDCALGSRLNSDLTRLRMPDEFVLLFEYLGVGVLRAS